MIKMRQLQVEIYEKGESDIYDQNVFDNSLDAIKFIIKICFNCGDTELSHINIFELEDGETIDCVTIPPLKKGD